MRVKYLYYPDCPSHEKGLLRLEKVLAEAGEHPEIETICVDSEEKAQRLGFIGSPTILVDGEDIDPQDFQGQSPGLTCRVYRLEDGRFSPLPSERMIHRAVKQAANLTGDT